MHAVGFPDRIFLVSAAQDLLPEPLEPHVRFLPFLNLLLGLTTAYLAHLIKIYTFVCKLLTFIYFPMQ